MYKANRKLLLTSILLISIFLFIILVNHFYKPITKYKYSIKYNDNNQYLDRSLFNSLSYFSYEDVAVYLNKNDLTGTFLDVSYIRTEEGFEYSYAFVGSNKNLINNKSLIDYYLENLNIIFQNNLIVESKKPDISVLNDKKDAILKICDGIYEQTFSGINIVESITYNFLLNDIELNLNLADCIKKEKKDQVFDLIDQIFSKFSYIDSEKIKKIELKFEIDEKIEKKGFKLKNIVFLYLIFASIILVLLYSIPLIKNDDK